MEFLKETLGEELFGQVSEKLKGTEFKLADLSKGEYVGIGRLKALETERDNAAAQLKEASKTIEEFKKMDIDGIKAAADEWKVKAETAQKEADKKVQAIKFDTAFEKALSSANVKDPKTVIPFINRELLKLTDDGIIGLKEQVEPLLQSHAYLFNIENSEEKQLPSGTKPFQPDTKPANPNSWEAKLAEARKNNNLQAVIAIKQQAAAEGVILN